MTKPKSLEAKKFVAASLLTLMALGTSACGLDNFRSDSEVAAYNAEVTNIRLFNQSIESTIAYINDTAFSLDNYAELVNETNSHGETIRHYRVINPAASEKGFELITSTVDDRIVDLEIIDTKGLVLPKGSQAAFHAPLDGVEVAWTAHLVIEAGDGTGQQQLLPPTLDAAQAMRNTVEEIIIASLASESTDK